MVCIVDKNKPLKWSIMTHFLPVTTHCSLSNAKSDFLQLFFSKIVVHHHTIIIYLRSRPVFSQKHRLFLFPAPNPVTVDRLYPYFIMRNLSRDSLLVLDLTKNKEVFVLDNKHQWNLDGLSTGDFQVSGGQPHHPQEQQAQDPRLIVPGCVIGICFNFCGGCAGCVGCAGCGGCAGRCGGCGGCGGCAGRCGGCGGRCGGCGGRCGGR